MKVDLDFTNVKSSGKIRVPEGDYLVKVKNVTKKKANTGNPMLVVDFMFLTGGEGIEGKTITDNHVLTENALWTLRNMLEAIGYSVPTRKMKFDDKMVLGKKVGLTVIDGEEYKGRISSEIADYVSPKIIGNLTSTTEASEDDEEGFLSDDEDSDDSDDVEEVEEDESEDESDDDSDDGDFAFEDSDDESDDADEEEEVALSFDEEDVEEAKAAELKKFYAEATEAGFEFDLPAKPKAKEVREALLTLFVEEDEEEDDEEFEEDFDLDDVE